VKSKGVYITVGAILLAIVTVSGGSLATAPYEWDVNTVLLDHFDNSTLAGYVSGTLNYVDSLPVLDRAADFSQETWARYALPGWYQWWWGYYPEGKEGTVELWVYPRQQYNIGIVCFQWYETSSPPPAGYIFYISTNAEGKLVTGVWQSPVIPLPPGNTTIPLNQWIHVACTWSPSGTRLYVNGQLDAFSPSNNYPALNPTFYVYVNGWGGSDLGYIDELRISKVARTEEEIRAHVASVLILTVAIDIKPGSDPNAINPNSKGVIPVAILTTPEFDATKGRPIERQVRACWSC